METSTKQTLNEKTERLFDWFDRNDCAVAFSGGVDSATLAKALVIATERRPTLTTEDGTATGVRKAPPTGFFAVGATSTDEEKRDAGRLAAEIGIALQVLETQELKDERFVANSPERCYWCKKIRFAELGRLAVATLRSGEEGEDGGATQDVKKTAFPLVLIDGTNADDANDFRPGTKAAREAGVRSPFAELGITKAEIRALARNWGLSVAEKPSNPCLATRIGYGLPLDVATLRRIEAAEIAVKRFGFSTCRVRVDAPGAARIEVPEAEIDAASTPSVRRGLVGELRGLGFAFVSLDLEGFASGKGNRILDASKSVGN
ncbi:MAG: ATP-dependent sacrificial sulfur transferase LarE [Thermoguttaceae bacterium]|nr:ATP-dependent sacrificial sulfur transferase LarE [Thermoguttaceae bacterium]MBQ9801123.1 ATP-dependent sacrificial sulfur transferase LarE [Thermoguttaceae bacterium]